MGLKVKGQLYLVTGRQQERSAASSPVRLSLAPRGL